MGHPEVFIIGDAAYREENGEPLPMVAPVAIQMGQSVARNIKRQLRGQPLQPFRYRDQGTLATIGRNAAVANVFGVQASVFIRVGDVARDSHHSADRLSQQALRADQLGRGIISSTSGRRG